MKNLSSRRISLFAVVLVSTIGLLFTHHTGMQQHSHLRSVYSGLARIQKQNSPNSSSSHRKLLHSEGAVKPNRVWGEKCSTSDIVVNQGPTSPLPNGIPTYTVEIVNACATGCKISGIHLRCGWFSSARLINPKLFKRLRHDDCLVNDGKPLQGGAILSFQYANSFPYQLYVSSVVCHG